MTDLRPRPAVSGRLCEYAGLCRVPAIWSVRIDGRRRLLCNNHAAPEFHPSDLHNRLPSRLRRALANRKETT